MSSRSPAHSDSSCSCRWTCARRRRWRPFSQRFREKWGHLDFPVHSLAFAPKGDLQGRLVDSSVEGFFTAMDISCHSFMRMAKLSEPRMTEGSVLVTMSYYGAVKVVPNYSLMGPVKAALDAAVRYLAYELGPKGIRVHAVSPGLLKTRAASGLAHFDELLAEAKLRRRNAISSISSTSAPPPRFCARHSPS